MTVFPTQFIYERSPKMRDAQNALKPFGIYSFLVKDKEKLEDKYPLFIYFDVPRYNIARGIYGLNLLNIPRNNIALQVMDKYIMHMQSDDGQKMLATQFYFYERSLAKDAYKYYQWKDIHSNMFVEINPEEARRILNSNVFKR